jgi:hypothetical protein
LPANRAALTRRQKRLAADANAIIAANPTQFDAASMYFKKGITLHEATQFLRQCYVIAALMEARFNSSKAGEIGGFHRNLVRRVVPPLGLPRVASAAKPQPRSKQPGRSKEEVLCQVPSTTMTAPADCSSNTC